MATVKKPIITWLNEKFEEITADKKIQFSSDEASFQPVIADTDSVPTVFYIANNFKKGTSGTEDVADATDCKLQVVSENGLLNSPVVTEKWIKAKCETLSTDFTQLGAETKNGKLEALSMEVACVNHGSSKVIKGTKNSGGTEEATTNANMAKVTAVAHPPQETNAVSGKNTFRFRLIYSFGETV